MYNALFKCRLCGKTYVSAGTSDERIAFNAVLCMTGVKLRPSPCSPTLTEVHACKDGGYGIADFQGFQKIDDGGDNEN